MRRSRKESRSPSGKVPYLLVPQREFDDRSIGARQAALTPSKRACGPTRLIAGRERKDPRAICPSAPVATHTSPAVLSSPVTPKDGGHQRHKLRIVAPYRLRAETEIRQRRPPPRPGRA